MKIVADDKIPFLKGVFEPFAELVYLPGQNISRADLKNADALITRTRTICDKQLLHATQVSFIATATIGYDHIDTAWCESNGIHWTNAAGCNAGSVAQYIAAVLVHLSRKHNFRFADRTLGVIGVGNVGRNILNVAEALGLRVVCNDPPRVRKSGACGFVSLDGIFREADIITLHTPLNHEGIDKTFHLVDAEFMKHCRKETILINSSRGEVVDNRALYDALSQQLIADAVCDVWENEPNIDNNLLEKVALGTPHIAGYSADGKANGTTMVVQAIARTFGIPELLRWKPYAIQKPANNLINIDCTSIDDQEALCRAIEATYPISRDDQNLRANPNYFEKIRGDYPLRREFQAYQVNLKNGRQSLIESLIKLGFIVN